MRAVLLFAALVAIALAQPLATEEYAAKLNAIKGTTWTASAQAGTRIEGATEKEIKRLLGVTSFGGASLEKRTFTAEERAIQLPDTFEAKDKWPQCPTITDIRDQSECGSCWAVAAASAMSDRYCTTGPQKVLRLSDRDMLSCCWYCGNGCSGGNPSMAWNYWVSTGLVSDDCQPYPFPKCEHHVPAGKYPKCPSTEYPTPKCVSNGCTANGTTPNNTKYKGAKSYGVSGEDDFKRELYTNGPFEVAFSVYDDFPLYKTGVYTRQSSKYLGGHAVRLVGWGSLNGVPYWKIANSWNEDWGAEGYFLIKRGNDECGIEDRGVAGIAAQ